MKRASFVRKSMVIGAAVAGALCVSGGALAEEWGDTMIGYSYGRNFAEPFAGNNVQKNIFTGLHVGGYKYGTQLIAADFLFSSNADPATPVGPTSSGAQEVYAVYRNTVNLSKVTGNSYKSGIIKDFGGTFGFDANTKNNAYASKKRMFVAGPTLMLEPGNINMSLLALFESNAPGATPRYTYKSHAAFDMNWFQPFGNGFSFQGSLMIIAPKGNDEFGLTTRTETNFQPTVMYDMSPLLAMSKNSFKLGLGYQYWKNKFGNDASAAASGGSGAFAKTTMLKAEYHF